MTYIEFFDKASTENICSCLTQVPDRVIIIGDSTKKLNKYIKNYEQIFADRGHEIEFIPMSVSKSNLDDAVALLSGIVAKYDDIVFDITGGDELSLLALGIVYANNPDRNIQIHKINIKNNMLYDCDKDGNTVFDRPPVLSVREQIRLYGGDIVYGGVSGNDTYLWDLSNDFVRDVDHMWSVCRGNVRMWNTQIGVLSAIEEVGDVSDDGLTTNAKITDIDRILQKHRAEYKMINGIMNCLKRDGLVTSLTESDGEWVSISYKNEQVKKCLTKAGQALEMKVFITTKTLADDEGSPVYDDALNGVVIDWDGEIHDDENGASHDTENEIDILLMHDIVPVFISCKNGIVTADELYKLNTVAERFGGKYARKVLVATSISLIGEPGEYIRQRAEDMGITLIEDIQTLNDEALAKKLNKLWLPR